MRDIDAASRVRSIPEVTTHIVYMVERLCTVQIRILHPPHVTMPGRRRTRATQARGDSRWILWNQIRFQGLEFGQGVNGPNPWHQNFKPYLIQSNFYESHQSSIIRFNAKNHMLRETI